VENSIETSLAQPTPAEQAGKSAAPDAPKTHRVGVQLVANGQSDVPMLANFARVQISSPAVVVDFGFLEPDALNALSQMAGNGTKMPDAIRGRQAARVALTPDALVALYQQLGQAITGLRAIRETKQEKN
jgi:hypothetical protein